MADEKPHQHDQQITVNLDTTPVLYTDSISMATNEDGLVIDFLQRLGNTNQLKIVSRIGMSRSHAKKFMDSLGKLLLLTEGTHNTGDKN